MKKRVLSIIIFNMIALFLLLLYYKVAEMTGFYVPCMFKKLTGLKCPGCGVTHMTYYLIHFQFKEAFYSNPIIFILCIAAVLVIPNKWYIYIRYNELKETKFDKIVMLIFVIALLIFGVLRNTVLKM